MADDLIFKKVKTLLGITGDYQDETIKAYMEEVIAYMVGAGVPEDVAETSAGVIARGVNDLYMYGNGTFSQYFYERVIQLTYKGDSSNV